jgi:hypothetical protein
MECESLPLKSDQWSVKGMLPLYDGMGLESPQLEKDLTKELEVCSLSNEGVKVRKPHIGEYVMLLPWNCHRGVEALPLESGCFLRMGGIWPS